VTSCDLAKPELACESTAVLGAPGACSTSRATRCSSGRRLARGGGQQPRALGRVPHPLDGSAPSALKVAAARSTSSRSSKARTASSTCSCARRRGDGMWAAETNSAISRCCACT
jgi:hypothetical protein